MGLCILRYILEYQYMNQKDLTVNSPIENEQNEIILEKLSLLYRDVSETGRQVACLDTESEEDSNEIDFENLQFKLYQLGLVPRDSNLQNFKIFADIEDGIFMFGIEARCTKDGRPWNARIILEQNEDEPAHNFSIVKSREFFKNSIIQDENLSSKNEILLDAIIFFIYLFNKNKVGIENIELKMNRKKLEEDLTYLEEVISRNSRQNFKAGKLYYVSLVKNSFDEIILTLYRLGNSDNSDYIIRIKRWGNSFIFKKKNDYHREGENRTVPKSINNSKELGMFCEMAHIAINGLNAKYVKSITQ